MKTTYLICISLLFSTQFIFGQKESIAEPTAQYIEWFGDNEIANSYVSTGIWHFLNAEDEKAISFFMEAIDQDPSLFGPHALISWVTWGETRDNHVAKANEKVAGKNEVSKLFVSLLDLDNPKEGDAYPIWKKMHSLSPTGSFIHFYYARSIPDSNEGLATMERLLKSQSKENLSWTPHVHNALGYLHYREGQRDLALEHFMKYVELYPEGYNPYDSLGEFYLNEGNKELAVKYFTKAVEQYPGAINAVQMLDKIELDMDAGHTK